MKNRYLLLKGSVAEVTVVTAESAYPNGVLYSGGEVLG